MINAFEYDSSKGKILNYFCHILFAQCQTFDAPHSTLILYPERAERKVMERMLMNLLKSYFSWTAKRKIDRDERNVRSRGMFRMDKNKSRKVKQTFYQNM